MIWTHFGKEPNSLPISFTPGTQPVSQVLALMYLLLNCNTTFANATLSVWINENAEISGLPIKTSA